MDSEDTRRVSLRRIFALSDTEGFSLVAVRAANSSVRSPVTASALREVRARSNSTEDLAASIAGVNSLASFLGMAGVARGTDSCGSGKDLGAAARALGLGGGGGILGVALMTDFSSALLTAKIKRCIRRRIILLFRSLLSMARVSVSLSRRTSCLPSPRSGKTKALRIRST